MPHLIHQSVKLTPRSKYFFNHYFDSQTLTSFTDFPPAKKRKEAYLIPFDDDNPSYVDGLCEHL